MALPGATDTAPQEGEPAHVCAGSCCLRRADQRMTTNDASSSSSSSSSGVGTSGEVEGSGILPNRRLEYSISSSGIPGKGSARTGGSAETRTERQPGYPGTPARTRWPRSRFCRRSGRSVLRSAAVESSSNAPENLVLRALCALSELNPRGVQRGYTDLGRLHKAAPPRVPQPAGQLATAPFTSAGGSRPLKPHYD